jgi:hypothetical protein
MQTNLHSIAVYPMLRELRRYSHTTALRIGGNRWDRWAERLIRRHSRMLASLGALAMTVLGRGALRYLTNERWNVLSQRFDPRITLAFQPIIRVTLLRERERWLFPLRAERTLVSRSGPRELHLARLMQRRVPSQDSIPSAPHHHSPSSRMGKREIVIRSTPLHFIFQRLHHLTEFSRKHQQDELTLQNVSTQLRRVVRRVQRVEEQRIDAPLAFVTRQSTALAAFQSLALIESRKATASGDHGTRGKRVGTSLHNIPASQPLNIEALTDQVVQQIDRRITARRERMGKI